MARRLILLQVIFLCCWNVQVLGQLTEDNRIAFVRIYLESKKMDNNEQIEIQELLMTSGIELIEIREIMQKSVLGEELDLSDEAKVLIARLERQKEIANKKKEKALLELIEKHGIERKMYEEILKKYQSDIHFNRSLGSLFRQEMDKND